MNSWNDFGGKNKYVQWAKERGQNVKTDDDFYTHPVVKQYYKNHIKVAYLDWWIKATYPNDLSHN